MKPTDMLHLLTASHDGSDTITMMVSGAESDAAMILPFDFAQVSRHLGMVCYPCDGLVAGFAIPVEVQSMVYATPAGLMQIRQAPSEPHILAWSMDIVTQQQFAMMLRCSDDTQISIDPERHMHASVTDDVASSVMFMFGKDAPPVEEGESESRKKARAETLEHFKSRQFSLRFFPPLSLGTQRDSRPAGNQ